MTMTKGGMTLPPKSSWPRNGMIVAPSLLPIHVPSGGCVGLPTNLGQLLAGELIDEPTC